LSLVSQFFWHPHQHSSSPNKWYVEAPVPEELRQKYGRRTSLHRVISAVASDIEIDHENGNGLDCRDGNLRPATRQQNTSNRRYYNRTGYRGVFLTKGKKNPFGAQIEHNGKNNHIGVFSTAEAAALAYNERANALFGEFAILNEIGGVENARTA
jgi:hypothetical protein